MQKNIYVVSYLRYQRILQFKHSYLRKSIHKGVANLRFTSGLDIREI
jgi:hypothetical protein